MELVQIKQILQALISVALVFVLGFDFIDRKTLPNNKLIAVVAFKKPLALMNCE